MTFSFTVFAQRGGLTYHNADVWGIAFFEGSGLRHFVDHQPACDSPVAELIRRYNPDHKIVFVGDAAMGPYEITHPGGSVEYWNEEAGQAWFQRVKDRFRKVCWINPNPPERWKYMMSTEMIRELVEDRMYPLTLDGLEAGLKELQRGR